MQSVGALTCAGCDGARAEGYWGADVVEERRRLRSMKRGHASRTPPPTPPHVGRNPQLTLIVDSTSAPPSALTSSFVKYFRFLEHFSSEN